MAKIKLTSIAAHPQQGIIGIDDKGVAYRYNAGYQTWDEMCMECHGIDDPHRGVKFKNPRKPSHQHKSGGAISSATVPVAGASVSSGLALEGE